jgi:phosphoribosylformylglycinamidine synthase
MKFGVIVFPGSNCDYDCFYVIKDIIKQPVSFIWHQQQKIENYDCIILPGGFSYGDYLRAGSIAKFSPVMQAVVDFANKGGLVVGICNGFQILLESGLLPGAMLRNKDVHFICQYLYIKTENTKTPFTNLCPQDKPLKIPIAHNEGNYFINQAELEELEKNGQIIFRYCDANGAVSSNDNPNGALANIAGVANNKGNVLGMMPHPERSSQAILGSRDGAYIFNSIVNWINRS